MTFSVLPEDKRTDALRMHRAGVTPAEIHRFVWPKGQPAVSYGVLQTMLRAYRDAEDEIIPPDDLPDGLETAMADLEEARGRIMDTMRAGGPDGECNPQIFSALSKNVEVMIRLSQHKIELQRHRIELQVRKPRTH